MPTAFYGYPAVNREFDLILYGATGGTGRPAAAYFAEHAPAGLKWAAAGRDWSRLNSLCLPVPLLVADSRDSRQLDALAERTHLVLNLAGPFRLYGDPLVAACIRQRTHYCDISGETARIRDLIDRHHTEAAERRLRIVPFCGVSSVPVDLAVHLLTARLGVARPEVKAALRLQGGRFGAGTIASIGEAVTSGDAFREADPFLLGPAGRSPEPRERDPHGIHYDRDLRAWTLFSPMGVSDTRAVRRSAALGGRDLVFQEYLAFDSFIRAAATWLALGGFRAALRWRSTRALLQRLASSRDERAEASDHTAAYDLRVTSAAANGRRADMRVRGQGDPGGRITVVCACECALALATQQECLPDIFGVLTPSIAIGDILIARLRAAGLSFDADAL